MLIPIAFGFCEDEKQSELSLRRVHSCIRIKVVNCKIRNTHRMDRINLTTAKLSNVRIMQSVQGYQNNIATCAHCCYSHNVSEFQIPFSHFSHSNASHSPTLTSRYVFWVFCACWWVRLFHCRFLSEGFSYHPLYLTSFYSAFWPENIARIISSHCSSHPEVPGKFVGGLQRWI